MDAEEAGKVCTRVLQDGGAIWVIGNGGSATMASHFAAEMVGSGFKCYSLCDVGAITALANDYGYEQVFYRQLHALARPKDLVVALTTSGKSQNILMASMAAMEIGCYWIQSDTGDDTQKVQEAHLAWLHSIWLGVSAAIYGESSRRKP